MAIIKRYFSKFLLWECHSHSISYVGTAFPCVPAQLHHCIPYLPFTKRAALRCTISNLSELYFLHTNMHMLQSHYQKYNLLIDNHCDPYIRQSHCKDTARAGQWVKNLGTVGNRYNFEFSILLIETAWAGRIVFTRLTVYLIVNRISTNRVTISL